MTLKLFMCLLGVASALALDGTGNRVNAAGDDLAAVKGMAEVPTVSYRETERRPGKPDVVSRVRILGPDLVRVESADGYAVTDFGQEKALLIDPARKSATLLNGVSVPGGRPLFKNLYEMLRKLPEMPGKPLPDRVVDGKAAVGLQVERDGHVMKVWADPATRQPVLIEEPLGDDPKALKTSGDFVFGGKLDESLFSLTPPEGYKLETFGVPELRPERGEASQLRPVVRPGVGIGAVRFGMSRDRIIQAVGGPDKLVSQGKAEILEYYSRGYSLLVAPERGLMSITCLSPKFFAIKVRKFEGRTDRGIGMGATRAQIVKAYGKPDHEHVSKNKDVFGKDAVDPEKPTGQTGLDYDTIGISFSLYDDSLHQIYLTAPRPPKKPAAKEAAQAK